MLTNLKRVYVKMHSFPAGARNVADNADRGRPVGDRRAARNRGLLAYHLKDFFRRASAICRRI